MCACVLSWCGYLRLRLHRGVLLLWWFVFVPVFVVYDVYVFVFVCDWFSVCICCPVLFVSVSVSVLVPASASV